MADIRLWILRPRNERDPLWRYPHDKAFGFVVRAETAEDARLIAAQEAGDEGIGAWMSAALSSCDELTAEGERGIVLRDACGG